MLGLGLRIFLGVVSLRESDFFEGNSTSKTLTKFDDHPNSPCLGLRNFLDGLTESVRLFCGTLSNNVRLGLGLGIFLDVVSLKVSDFFEGN